MLLSFRAITSSLASSSASDAVSASAPPHARPVPASSTAAAAMPHELQQLPSPLPSAHGSSSALCKVSQSTGLLAHEALRL